MHDKYLIYFDLQAFLIWFAQQIVLRLKLHDPKVHDTQLILFIYLFVFNGRKK